MAQEIGVIAIFDVSQFNSGLRQYNSGIASANSSTENFGSSMSSLGSIAGGAAVAGLAAFAAGLAAVAAGLSASVAQAASFEQSIADIAAVTGNSIADVEELRDLALELSLDPNLSVTANEAAEALQVLAKNGVEVEDILGGVGRATIEAANATGEDFALAADVATDALNLFGIEADDFSSVSDNLTGVLVNSKFGLDDMRLALSQGGAVAANAGIEFDEFSAIIAATSSNFASGSDAGTAFKTFIQRLTAPTGKAKSELAALGISIFDTAGEMRSMTDIFADFAKIGDQTISEGFTLGGRSEEQEEELKRLQKELANTETQLRDYASGLAGVRQSEAKKAQTTDQLSREQAILIEEIAKLESIQSETITTNRKLTEQEQQRALTTIFGADAIRFATGAMQLQEGELEALTAAINEEGLAQQAAATRTQTFEGALERLTSAYEFLKIQIGTPLLAPLTDFFDNTVTQGIRDLGTLVETFNELGASVALAQFEDLSGFDLPQIDLSGLFATGGDFLTPIVEQIQALASITVEGGGVGLLGALGFSEETLALVDAYQVEFSAFGETLSSAFDDISNLQDLDFGALLTTSIEAFSGIRNELIDGASVALGGVVDAFIEFSNTPEFISGVDFLTTQIANVVVAGITTSFKELPAVAESLAGLTVSLLEAGATAFVGLASLGGLILSKIITGFVEEITGGEIKTLTLTELYNLFSDISELTGAQVLEFGARIGQFLLQGIGIGFNAGVELLYTGISSLVSGMVGVFTSLLGIASPSTVFAEFGLNIIQGLVNGIIENASLVATALTGAVGGALASAGEALALPDLGISEFLGGGEDDTTGDGEGGGALAGIAETVGGAGEAFEQFSGVISDLATPAFDAVGEATSIFDTEAAATSTTLTASLTPSFSALSSTLASNVAPSFDQTTAASEDTLASFSSLVVVTGELDVSTNELNVSTMGLNITLTETADLIKRISKFAENSIEPLTDLRNVLRGIATELTIIQSAGGGGAVGSVGADTAANVGNGFASVNTFSDVNNSQTTTNYFDLTIRSEQPSNDIVRDIARLQALV